VTSKNITNLPDTLNPDGTGCPAGSVGEAWVKVSSMRRNFFGIDGDFYQNPGKRFEKKFPNMRKSALRNFLNHLWSYKCIVQPQRLVQRNRQKQLRRLMPQM